MLFLSRAAPKKFNMSQRSRLTMGEGAVVSVLAKFIHPSEHIRRVLPNVAKNHRVNNLVVKGVGKKVIRRKEQEVVIFVSDEFKTDDGTIPEMYAVQRYCQIVREGPADKYFSPGATEHLVQRGEVQIELPEEVQQATQQQILNADDISRIRGMVTIDDDNMPAPENIPDETIQSTGVLSNEWGHSGICYRRMDGVMNQKARLHFTSSVQPTRLQLFEIFFPKPYITEILIPETNKNLSQALNYGEFLVFLGIWLMMATIQGFQRRDFWSSGKVDIFKTAPYRFNDIMSRNRFEAILGALTYTSRTPPTYKDPFWEIRELQDSWNENMVKNFVSSWITCLDESMMKWINEYTCPGFMFVPRKPWPFGNEWHTICCADSGIMFGVELVEGKDSPPQKPTPLHQEMGKTVGLLLRLTHSLHGTGKIVVLDSGFCVLKGIIELKKRGVFAAALIKKRKYWPKYIDGDRIKQHFTHKNVGDVDALKGELESVRFHVFAMKEEDYVMMLMSTYGTCNRVGEDKARTVGSHRIRIHFKYPEVVHNHYKYRDAVDSHNARRQSPIAIEETWQTSRWANRVFAFLLAISEVNANLGESYFGTRETTRPQLEFRRLLARDLIENPYQNMNGSPSSERRSKRIRDAHGHELVKVPRGKKFKGTVLVSSKSNYPYNFCYCRQQRVRTYCKCTPGMLLCPACFAIHCQEVENG